jgi:hypothetical protein
MKSASLAELIREATDDDKAALRAALDERPKAPARPELSDGERRVLGARWGAVQARRAKERPAIETLMTAAGLRREQATQESQQAFSRLCALDSELGEEIDAIFAAGESGRPAWLDEFVAELDREAAEAAVEKHAVKTSPFPGAPATLYTNADSLEKWRAGLRQVGDMVRARVIRCELVTREDALAYVAEERKRLPVVERARDVAQRLARQVEEAGGGR